jgi:IS1 family transposase
MKNRSIFSNAKSKKCWLHYEQKHSIVIEEKLTDCGTATALQPALSLAQNSRATSSWPIYRIAKVMLSSIIHFTLVIHFGQDENLCLE